MASILYDGVQSAEGGNIFKDMKFWVSHRVPIRSIITKWIQENGGELVRQEKDASMLIADGAKKFGIPPGAVDWKFIRDSIQNGYCQLEDRYRIGRNPDVPRPVASRNNTKGTRTPFTKADDAALVKWVLSHTVNQTGNKIFQDYEKMNPRHTWQSWRNRYVKQLQSLPTDQLERMAASAPDLDPETNDASRERQATSNLPQPGPTPIQKPNSKPKPRVLPPSISRSLPGTERRPESDAISTTTEPARRRENQGVVNGNAEPRRIRAPLPLPPSTEEEVPNIIIPAAEQTSQDRPSHALSSIPDSEASQDSYDRRRERFIDDLIIFMQAKDLNINLHPVINGVKFDLYDLAHLVNEQDTSSARMDWIQVASKLGFNVRDGRTISQLKDCYHDSLADFLEAMEAAPGSDQISDEHVDEEEDEEEDPWQGRVEEREAEEEYDGDVVVHRSREPTPQDEHYPQEASRSPQSYIPSSPPTRFATNKRTLSHNLPSSGRSAKRRRYDRNAEIPSTPDEKIGVIRQAPFTQNLSPSIRKNLLRSDYIDESEASQHLPPLPAAAMDEEEDEEVEEEFEEADLEGEEDEVEEEEHEEEHYEEETLAGQETSPAEPTPSQQLHHETVDATPIPIHLRQQSHPSKKPITQPEKDSRPSRRNRTTEPVEKHTTIASTPTSTQARKPSRPSFPSSFPSSASQPLRKLPGALPPRHSVSDQSNREEIQDWIVYYQSLGFPQQIVIEGLKRTTMTPGRLATLVMQQLKEGNTIPTHHEGIWTDRDDDDLKLIDATDRRQTDEKVARKAKRALDRLLNKHGAARMDLRRAFLEAQREGSENLPTSGN